MRSACLLLLFVVLFSAGLTAAQDSDLTESYTFESGAAFKYPADWTLEDNPQYLIDVYSERTIIYFIDFAGLESQGFDPETTLVEVVQAYFETFYDSLKFKADKVQEIELGGREAVRYDFQTPETDDSIIIVIRFSDGAFGLLEGVSSPNNFPEEDIVLAIAGSFDSGGGEPPDTAGGLTLSADQIFCKVTTDRADTVRIRVGPGTNRTSYAFLPANEEFTVLGKAEANDGSLWWKLDKETAAPGKSANEAWIAADDVDSSGNCEAVVDVNAPPIIPIVAAPPPSTGGGGNSGGDTSGGAIPSTGSWTVTYAPYAPGSCLGTGTVNIPLDFAPERYSVSSASSSSVVFGGVSFGATQAGVYQGLFSAPDGSSVLTTLRVASPTLMGLEFILTFQVEDTSCSMTVNGTVTHN